MAMSKGQRAKLLVSEYNVVNKSVILSFVPTRLLNIEGQQQEEEEELANVSQMMDDAGI